ncbi:hypothetical protein BKA67DRAFT_578921 [Truncatella angustata]|uniref:Protein kinase domain-containing protein n=1 Tax=Truncatella angustata TaxID=152316 RepID=A0A9P8UAZ2_9PEZI|nr:uncharacterized protein BKA67DRAFT_578921 [Truncatella angustata]KAH6647931.1 hypothetical protein BKA67DRAFT_578921 [Truncatella angustata]
MAPTLKSPYVKGNILTLKIHHLGKHAPLQLKHSSSEVRAQIVDVIEPSTMSVVVIVELEPPTERGEQSACSVSPLTAPAPKMVLKVYERQFSSELRQFKETGPATTDSEEQYATFLRGGSMPQFLVDHAENGRFAYEEWDVPKLEAYFHVESTRMHEIEVQVYDRLLDLQGIHVPKFYADVRLAPQHAIVGEQLDEGLTEYTEIRAIMIEYIHGFPLLDLVTETPESDWPVICNQAIEAVNKIIDYNFINFDLATRNILVRRSESEHSYQVFYIDFAQCRFRDASDSDEVWRERKRQKDEEGAVGYLLAGRISFAKGKKGKKYKGNLPLPWTYTPSARFEGEYIELYSG